MDTDMSFMWRGREKDFFGELGYEGFVEKLRRAYGNSPDDTEMTFVNGQEPSMREDLEETPAPEAIREQRTRAHYDLLADTVCLGLQLSNPNQEDVADRPKSPSITLTPIRHRQRSRYDPSPPEELQIYPREARIPSGFLIV
ncbi:hypothetical protein FS749_006729 [Ceratobasidium sp. UAMH 11750]|nr:hypothetical protein FS749_006729 [Ceratobasidium sp. UAMH 11750]